jgi:hypothetical protein
MRNNYNMCSNNNNNNINSKQIHCEYLGAYTEGITKIVSSPNTIYTCNNFALHI